MALLEIRNLCKSFGGLQAINNVSLSVKENTVHGLIGPNGSGKSTFFNLITGVYKPDKGSLIEFNKVDITDKPAHFIAAQGLARTFQVSSVAPDLTALENVMLAVQGASHRTFHFFRPALADAALTGPAREHMARVGLKGSETVAASILSHGERRRLELAMALAGLPSVAAE